MNILIAEDDAITLRRLQHFLEKWDHRVVTAVNGKDALEKFMAQDVELVITDWMMPEMDGMELVRRIRSGGSDKPYVYTILLTSRGEKEDVVKGLSEVGVDDYVVKPFEPDELRARLSVGERTVRLERTLREYGKGLEKIVRMQTRLIRKTQEETIIRLLNPGAADLYDYVHTGTGLWGENNWRSLTLEPPSTSRELLNHLSFFLVFLVVVNYFNDHLRARRLLKVQCVHEV